MVTICRVASGWGLSFNEGGEHPEAVIRLLYCLASSDE